jgi:hypothetical protein
MLHPLIAVASKEAPDMKRAFLTLAALLAFLPCCRQSASAQAAPTSNIQDGYKLRIELTGLIGFAVDSGKLWAFLVNADHDPVHPIANRLPPGFLDEAKSVAANSDALAAVLSQELPRHRAWIRFKDAKIAVKDPQKSFVAETGRPIAGGDLRFKSGQAGPVSTDLAMASDAQQIVKALKSEYRDEAARQQSLARLTKLDELDLDLLKTPLDPRLAARALIEAGSATAGQLSKARFLYKRGLTSTGCKGKVDDAVPLAEQVAVVQSGLKGSVVIEIGPGDAIEVMPKDPAQTRPVVVQILNDIDEVIDHPEWTPEHFLAQHTQQHTEPHPQAFRWLYLLVPPAAQKDVAYHYFPCMATLISPYCGVKRLVITKGAAQ